MAVIRRRKDQASAQRSEGFTLLEVVIVLGILGVGLLGAAAMQLYSLRQGQVGKHTTQATVLAQDRIESLMRMDFLTGLNPTGGWAVVGTNTNTIVTNSGTREELSYLVEQRITNATLNYTKLIDIRVTWSEPDDPNRQLVISTLRYGY
jgi:prepilin-type N-terminal cleavage/methylation domain-containing protein